MFGDCMTAGTNTEQRTDLADLFTNNYTADGTVIIYIYIYNVCAVSYTHLTLPTRSTV